MEKIKWSEKVTNGQVLEYRNTNWIERLMTKVNGVRRKNNIIP